MCWRQLLRFGARVELISRKDVSFTGVDFRLKIKIKIKISLFFKMMSSGCREPKKERK